MVPEAITRQLARVRARERGVAFAWGAARYVALAAAALFVACAVDWLVDLGQETPRALRATLLVLQVGLWLVAAAFLLVRPLLRGSDDTATALWVEDKFPALGHRVISAVQLNRPGAAVEGMSPELIVAVTRQADEQARALDFASKVDLTRLKRGGLIVAAAAGVAAVFTLAAPDTVAALVARQFMADREIPRSVALDAEYARRIWPSGEEVVLRIRARGDVPFERLSGHVRIYPADRPSESYPLVFEARAASPGEARFAARIPPSSSRFTWRARLKDGRLKRPAEIVYEPRPVARRIEATLLLPRYCGIRPDGTPYEQPRPRGEIAGPLGSSARVSIEAQKPLARASLEHLGRSAGEGVPEPVTRRTELTLGEGAQQGECVFELHADETAYRVVLEDRNGFLNTSPPRRSVTVVPEEPPRVVLLPERFAFPGEAITADEADVEGMPIPVGSAVRIAYYAAHPYGIDRARLGWRLLRGAQPSDEGTGPTEPWSYLPLREVRGTAESGPFDLRLGLFRNSGFREPVEFHPVPSPDPDRILGGVEGGGCFDFQTQPLAGVQPGDQIEFFIEVFARNPAMADQPGRSEVRTKTFVTQPQFVSWVLETLRHESRLRQLESRQRGVFAPEGTDR